MLRDRWPTHHDGPDMLKDIYISSQTQSSLSDSRLPLRCWRLHVAHRVPKLLRRTFTVLGPRIIVKENKRFSGFG